MVKAMLQAGQLGVVNRGDRGDQAFIVHERDVQVGVASVLKAEQNAAQAAKLRKSAGKDGICEDCGHEIPKARLAALPNATRCRGCQEISEAATRRGRVGFTVPRPRAN